MAYAIMRCKKLATMGGVASSLQHCYRDRETPNADSTRTPGNEHYAAQSTHEAMDKLRELLPEKRRKDAVLAVEYVMTASPEWWKSASQEQQADFFTRSKQWLADKYGADRIIVASIHRDEVSPHLSAFVVPLTKDGRLSAKEFIGNRSLMSRDQTTYADMVRALGLERGLEGSKARHTNIRQYYARASAAMPARTPPIDLPAPQLLESKAAYGVRAAQAVLDQVEPEMSVLKAKSQQTALAEQRASVAEQRQKQSEIALSAERDKVHGLTSKLKEIIATIVRGGDALAKMQESIRERIERPRGHQR